ncbi:hypothetical protein CUMW_207980, partial [Citrus unshiu]
VRTLHFTKLEPNPSPSKGLRSSTRTSTAHLHRIQTQPDTFWLLEQWNIREHLLSFYRIGIRSEYPNDVLERSIKGNSVAISSPRLVIPGTTYGSWVLSHQDNEDLQFVFPENEGISCD